MSRYEQLSMFTMNVEQVTATCCMDGCPARASPVEPWMAELIPAGEYVVQVAGHPLVLRPMPGRQANIQRGHEYYHYMIGGFMPEHSLGGMHDDGQDCGHSGRHRKAPRMAG